VIEELTTEKMSTPNIILRTAIYLSRVFVPLISPYPTVVIVVTVK
jgi:hypothetical protein